jgi:hypothetical protein
LANNVVHEHALAARVGRDGRNGIVTVLIVTVSIVCFNGVDRRRDARRSYQLIEDPHYSGLYDLHESVDFPRRRNVVAGNAGPDASDAIALASVRPHAPASPTPTPGRRRNRWIVGAAPDAGKNPTADMSIGHQRTQRYAPAVSSRAGSEEDLRDALTRAISPASDDADSLSNADAPVDGVASWLQPGIHELAEIAVAANA